MKFLTHPISSRAVFIAEQAFELYSIYRRLKYNAKQTIMIIYRYGKPCLTSESWIFTTAPNNVVVIYHIFDTLGSLNPKGPGMVDCQYNRYTVTVTLRSLFTCFDDIKP